MFNKKTVRDIDVKGQNVLVRTDYNVPFDNDGNISDDLRIKASLPTIEYLLSHGANKVILMSHLGKPAGARDSKYSLKPAAERLQKLLPNVSVRFVDDTCGPDVEDAVEALPKGGILLLENLRFSPGEEKNSEDYAREIVDSTHTDIYVDDGFAVVHRKHASVDAITNLLPSVSGLLLEKEIQGLGGVIDNPKHPLLVIIGGSKVEDKQPMIDNFIDIADHIYVAGKIAADGYQSTNPKVIVANDFVENEEGAKLDIGPESTAELVRMIGEAATIVWNGLTGKADDEDKKYAASSIAVAEAIGKSNGVTVIGGGDTAGFVENTLKQQPDLKYTLISTGGGASLEFLSGKELPGISALEDK